MNDTVVTIIVAVISSSAIASVIIAAMDRRRTASEIRKIEVEASSSAAEAFDAWLDSNIKIQKQREEDLLKHEKQIAQLTENYRTELEQVRSELTAEIKSLRNRISVLEKERHELLLANFTLQKEIDTMRGGGKNE